MTDYSKEVREEAARRANDESNGHTEYRADTILKCAPVVGRALCQAVQDGCLHLDPYELDRARWYQAARPHMDCCDAAEEYRRLVRDGWHPEPVDPAKQLAEEMRGLLGQEIYGADAVRAALDKLGYDLVKREAGQ